MKHFNKLFSLLIVSPLLAFAQNVGIGTSTPNASAMLDITSTNSGVLVPRVALTATNAAGPIATPATSLLVYNTNTAGVAPNNVTPGFYYWNGTNWVRFASGNAGWDLLGNYGTNAGTNYLGTNDATDLVIRTNLIEKMRIMSGGNVGIGTSAPNSALTVRTPIATANARVTSIANAISDPLFELATTKGSTTNFPGDIMTQIGQAYNGGAISEGMRFHRGIGASDGAISFTTSTTERVRINSAGNVGINQTNPTNKLDIVGGAARSGTHGTGLPFYATGNVGPDNSGFEFRHDNGTQGIGLGFNTIYATGSNAAQDLGLASRGTGNLNFSTNGAQRMIILGSNGNIGQGLTNPAYGLELNGSFGYGNGVAGSYRSRTETRDDAGQIATQSGFFETTNPSNYPAGASGWWHLIDSRHSNNANNFALQIAGSFFDQELWFRKTNNNGAQAWSKLLTSTSGWQTTGNSGTNAGTNFIGTTDAVDFVTRTTNVERMRVTSAGNVGIGIAAPTQKLDVQGGNARINNAFIGDVGHGAGWGGIAHASSANTTGYALIQSTTGDYTLLNKQNTGTGYIGFRVGNADQAVILNNGFMGIGTTVPAARLHVVNGSIRPQTGNNATSGIYFTPNPGGGGGDEAYIRHYVEAGENTKLVIANVNDAEDDISFQTGAAAYERIQINGNGTVYLNRGVFFDCNDCGVLNPGEYNLGDGVGGNWGDLSIQGRVLSANSNIHLSPPGGNRVIINSAYRAAGGGTGTTGLDIEDGGIRMRKNYRWINRYGSTGGYGWGAQTHNLGNWDFCSVGHVGFRNTNSATDEDDDVQCAVYPQAHADAGESNLWDSWFTYQYNQRPLWYMYLEGYADTNATNCAAVCINFD